MSWLFMANEFDRFVELLRGFNPCKHHYTEVRGEPGGHAEAKTLYNEAHCLNPRCGALVGPVPVKRQQERELVTV